MDFTHSMNTLHAGQMLNWYRIERVLGRGGFGVIYLAFDTNLAHPVAIKEYQPGNIATHDAFEAGLQRFIREARNLVRFKHPNIVRILSVFEANDTAYMVMEYEQGRTLSEYFADHPRPPEQTLKALLAPVIEGLAEVHRHGFVHRDIKPSNILVRENGSAVLLDFGSARIVGIDASEQLTAMVSTGYAPLEQYNHDDAMQQGPWTDIYALAGVLYRAVTGQAPVDSTRRASALLNGGKDPLIPATKLAARRYSEPFLNAIDHGLAFRIQDRPASLPVWREALLGYIAESDTDTVAVTDAADAASTDGAVEPTAERFDMRRVAREPRSGPRWSWLKKRLGRTDALWGLATLCLLILIAGSFWVGSRTTPDTSPREANVAVPATDAQAAGSNEAPSQQKIGAAQNPVPELPGTAPATPGLTAKPLASAESRSPATVAHTRPAATSPEPRIDDSLRRQALAQARRQLDTTLTETRALIAEGDFSAARARLTLARSLGISDPGIESTARALDVAEAAYRLPISDQEFTDALAQFDALLDALSHGDLARARALTVPSSQLRIFEQLAMHFETLRLSLHNIRVHNNDKSIAATLRIDEMRRANGDSAQPSIHYREREITSRRVGNGWSRIEW